MEDPKFAADEKVTELPAQEPPLQQALIDDTERAKEYWFAKLDLLNASFLLRPRNAIVRMAFMSKLRQLAAEAATHGITTGTFNAVFNEWYEARSLQKEVPQ